MFGLDMALINKAFYLGMAYCATYAAIPVFFNGKNKSATSGIAKDLGKLQGEDGFILGKKNSRKRHQLSYKYSKEGVCCIAPTGEGKTAAECETQLLSNHFPKSSIVIHDTKGELYDHPADYQRKIGRIPMLFEPLGKKNKIRINPLDFCINNTEIRQMAVDILTNRTVAVRLASSSGGLSGGDATWINMSVPLLTASLIHYKSLGRPHNNIPAAVRFLINSDAEVIEDTFRKF